MKSTYLVLAILNLLLLQTHAETWFPEFAKLSEAEQKAWGYELNFNAVGASMHLKIPPKAAKAVLWAVIRIKDSQGRQVVQTRAGLETHPDGSLSLSVELFEHLRGSAEVIIRTEKVEGTSREFKNFGGFAFRIPPLPH